MKKITFEHKNTLADIKEIEPIFAKKYGKLEGMVLCFDGLGWALSIGGDICSNGYHKLREECLKSNLKFGYTFFDKNMKEIDLNYNPDYIYFYDDILEDENIIIFSKKDGRISGMIILQDISSPISTGWTHYTGSKKNKLYSTKRECIKNGIEEGYEFYIED